MAVEIRATKAALYLYDGSGIFELVTEYGFRSGARRSADFNDPLVDRCGRGRAAFYVNGVAAEPRLSEILFEASTDRMLVAPIYSRGKLIGFIDSRDKAARQPFEQSDVPKAQRIADQIAKLLVDKNIFGHHFITLSEVGGSHPAAEVETASARASGARPATRTEAPVPQTPPAPPEARAAAPPPQPVSPPPAHLDTHTPRLSTLIVDARNIATRIIAAPPAPSLGEAELVATRDVLRAILLIPAAVTAMVSAFEDMGGVQEIAARGPLTDDVRNLLQSKLEAWLRKRGEPATSLRTNILPPLSNGEPIGTADVQKVFTAPIAAGGARRLYLTVAFATPPDRTAHELLAVLHGHLQLVIEQSLQRTAMTALRRRIAERLVEPEFARYPELRRHCEEVARLCETFARYLALPPADAENAYLVGIVHDAGMRLVEYDRLYRRRHLTEEELGFLREHPSVGAALVEPLLGSDVARAVLAHHERVDGHGYPHELHGTDIPLLSRIVQICDAWVAMTDAQSYQEPEPHEAALMTITRAAGGQFDSELADRFVQMMRRTPN